MECAVMRTFVLERPIAAGLALVSAADVLRLIDIFVLRLDEAWGEIIVSKVAAVVVLLGFIGVTGAGWSAAGFHARALLPSVALGAGLTIAALLAGFGAENPLAGAPRSGARA
jgi:hypothetical protein